MFNNMNPNFLGPNMMSTPPSYTNPNSNNLHFPPEMLQDYDYDYAQDFDLSYVNTLLNDDDHHHQNSNVVNNPFASSSSSSSSSSLFSQPLLPPPTIVQDKSSTTSASSGSFGFDGMMPTTTYPIQEVKSMRQMVVNRTKTKERHSIAFRTKTELETLDDGYKWRKYGKKKVKSNSNPRNYYKCSHEGCIVKKRVERDGEDSKFLITEYEGIHNHESPYVIYYY